MQYSILVKRMDEYVDAIITYKDTRVEFKGKPETVLESIYRFLTKEIPNLDLASKISLDYTLPEMINIFGDYVKITPEGPTVITDKKISDRYLIALQLIAYRMAKLLGKVERDNLSSQDIQRLTNLKPKTISSRLSDLTKIRCIEKINENGIKYKITTYGIHWLASELKEKVS
ncbi:MAG: hypothetical protein QW052_04605 [Candidatus Nitrosocaldaceae archaeon]